MSDEETAAEVARGMGVSIEEAQRAIDKAVDAIGGRLPDARWTREAVTLSPGRSHTFKMRYRYSRATGVVAEPVVDEAEGDGSEPLIDPADVDDGPGEPCDCGESFCTGVWFGPLLGHKTGRPIGILQAFPADAPAGWGGVALPAGTYTAGRLEAFIAADIERYLLRLLEQSLTGQEA